MIDRDALTNLIDREVEYLRVLAVTQHANGVEWEYTDHSRRKIVELSKEISALPACEAKVRELEWVNYDEGAVTASAKAPFMDYVIVAMSSRDFTLFLGDVVIGVYPTIEAAKAAAQADHAARIRSALTATPASDWLSNCAICGRVIDTRETSAGGDTHGCEYENGWACSPECAEKLNPDPDWMQPAAAADVAGLVEHLNRAVAAEAKRQWDASDKTEGEYADVPEVMRKLCEQVVLNAALARMKDANK